MFEQLSQLVKQFGQEDIVQNTTVPNEQNDAVMQETGSTILDSLKALLNKSGGLEQLGSLLGGNNASASNPVVNGISNQLATNLNSKHGIESGAASSLSASIIPKILTSLIGDAKNPAKTNFQMSDLVAAISGGGANSGGLMEAISKHGVAFGLDQNADGKLDMSDAMAFANKKGGIGGMLGKMFGK